MSDKITGMAKIKVIGVGGGGNNAVNRMIASGITSAEFVAVNTDMQALSLSNAPTKVQIGEKLTGGLGAGANPAVGEKAAEESQEELRALLKDVDLLFITAGMGGGTGTGAAPVIARLSRDLGILTVAVVTKPFPFEGNQRMVYAQQGIEKLGEYVDTLLVVPNAKLLEVLPDDISFVDAFIKADEVLRQAVQSLSDLIVVPSMINLDFADVCTVMKKKGLAHMGLGIGEGNDKTIQAIRNAVESPLLETNIAGAHGVIINIVGGQDLKLKEVSESVKLINDVVDPSANIIFGAGFDESLHNKVQVTLIATGFENVPMDEEEYYDEPEVYEAPQRKAENDVRSGQKRIEEAMRKYAERNAEPDRVARPAPQARPVREEQDIRPRQSARDNLYGQQPAPRRGYEDDYRYDERRVQPRYEDRYGDGDADAYRQPSRSDYGRGGYAGGYPERPNAYDRGYRKPEKPVAADDQEEDFDERKPAFLRLFNKKKK